VPPVLELPTDRPRPAVVSYRGTTFDFSLSRELCEGLGALGHTEGATLYMTILAALSLLLMRWSGQRDIPVGSPIAGRGRRELESLIGFFVNTLVLRTELVDELTFREVLAQVKQNTLAAYEHQEFPLEKLVEELQPVRSLSYSPLFQVMFVLQNTPGRALELPELTLSPVVCESSVAKFDLTLGRSRGPRASGVSGSTILTCSTRARSRGLRANGGCCSRRSSPVQRSGCDRFRS